MTSKQIPDIEVKPAPGISYFTPAQEPPAGLAADPQSDGAPIPKLFQPLKVRGITLHNRIGVRYSFNLASLDLPSALISFA
jgi:hypothetical protein